MTFLIIVIALVVLIAVFYKHPVTIKSNWQHFYDNIDFSTQDFYEKVESGLKNREAQDLKYAKESFLESHILSAKREYLRITKNEYVFYVCAAPFGTGMFISWWLCTKDESFINRIPLISRLFGKDRANKTFYQMDTEAMYKAIIHTTVVDTADNVTLAKGVRLSESERHYNLNAQ